MSLPPKWCYYERDQFHHDLRHNLEPNASTWKSGKGCEIINHKVSTCICCKAKKHPSKKLFKGQTNYIFMFEGDLKWKGLKKRTYMGIWGCLKIEYQHLQWETLLPKAVFKNYHDQLASSETSTEKATSTRFECENHQLRLFNTMSWSR